MLPTFRVFVSWLLVVGGSMEILVTLVRRKGRISGLDYGQMVAGAGWVVVGLSQLAPLDSTPAQYASMVGWILVLIGLWIRWRARYSRPM